MKLAEALSIRADLKNRIAQLKSRLKHSAKVRGKIYRMRTGMNCLKIWTSFFRNSKKLTT